MTKIMEKLKYLSRIAPATRLRRISLGATVLSGLLFLVWCSPASADNPPTWVGKGDPKEKPDKANSYVVTSDGKLLWDGAINITAAETNFPDKMNAFPGPVVDLLMQQCFGGGFAKGMQAAINQYTFTAATNWNELGLNVPGAPPPAVNNFTASWNQSYPRSEGLYTHYLDATNGAAAAPPNGAVTADPYGPMGTLRNKAKKYFENPSYASPDALVGGNPDPNGANNSRDIPFDSNQWAVLIAFEPDDDRFGVNIDRIYNSLRTVGFGVPANRIIVLYGDNGVNTTTPSGATPVNGPATLQNVTDALKYGHITGQGTPTPTPTPPDNNAHLFVYTTGHGNSFTLRGGRRVDTVPANNFKANADSMPANAFLAPDGSPVADNDTTSMVDLQISTRTPLVGSLSGTVVLVNGTSMGSLMDDNASPQTNLTDIIGTNYNYDVAVPAAYLNSFTPGSPVVIEVQNLNQTVTDNLVAAITFNDYDNAWSVSVDGACSPSWTPGPALPSVGVRSVGVYFPANGRFYAMGGRSADTAGSDFTHPFEYDPASNTWATKTATYPDNQVNNMACGVLTVSDPFICCVGGSAAAQTTATARVFFYDPVTDVVTTLTAADNWPGDAAGTILPGGFAVVNNKLYILGGFNINTASTNQIWQFDPTAAVGSKWTQEVNTPVAVMYAPTAAIGGIIYVGGASDFSGGTVIDTTNSFSFNPGTNSTGTIAAIPRATGETRALNFNGQMYVMGGGRVAPNPSTQVNIYDPVTNSWTTGTPFTTARRNFPTDTDGARIWLAGGYAPTAPTASMEIYQCNTTAPALSSAVSLKTQGGAGTFGIDLPQSPPFGVECRSGGATNDFTIKATFAGNVTVIGNPQAQVISGTGTVGSGGVSNGGMVTVMGNMVTIPLTNVADQQTITVRLNGVSSASSDQPAADVSISMSRLLGDSNGNRSVNAGDVAQVKSRIGQVVGPTNFRSDLNANGAFNAADVALAKANSGHAVP